MGVTPLLHLYTYVNAKTYEKVLNEMPAKVYSEKTPKEKRKLTTYPTVLQKTFFKF